MTKEEYINTKTNLEQAIKDYKSLLDGLHTEFIESNKQFNINDKVRVFNAKTGITIDIGIVRGFRISYDSVIPVLSKIKKDGSESKHELYIWHNYGFELLVNKQEL